MAALGRSMDKADSIWLTYSSNHAWLWIWGPSQQPWLSLGQDCSSWAWYEVFPGQRGYAWVTWISTTAHVCCAHVLYCPGPGSGSLLLTALATHSQCFAFGLLTADSSDTTAYFLSAHSFFTEPKAIIECHLCLFSIQPCFSGVTLSGWCLLCLKKP